MHHSDASKLDHGPTGRILPTSSACPLTGLLHAPTVPLTYTSAGCAFEKEGTSIKPNVSSIWLWRGLLAKVATQEPCLRPSAKTEIFGESQPNYWRSSSACRQARKYSNIEGHGGRKQAWCIELHPRPTSETRARSFARFVRSWNSISIMAFRTPRSVDRTDASRPLPRRGF